MTKIGMIVAIETEAIFERYGDVQVLDAPKGFELFFFTRGNVQMYIMHCGMGTINAAAGTQLLIDRCGVDVIVDYGVVGGLTPSMRVQRVVVVDRVVHYRYDVSEFMNLKVGQLPEHDDIYIYMDPKLVALAKKYDPEIKSVAIASGDKFVSKPEEKDYLNKTFGCEVCDMEAVGIALTCENNGIPCLLIKAVSDSLSGGAKEFWQELNAVSMHCLDVTDKIIDDIYQ